MCSIPNMKINFWRRNIQGAISLLQDEKMNGLSKMNRSGTDSPFLKQCGNNAC
jgi:hypothetical protein